MFVLDTNVVSELRKGPHADANVVRWADSVEPTLFFISVITIHELEHRVLLVERRDTLQGEVLRTWLQTSVLETFSTRILAVDTEIALRAAGAHVPAPAPFSDALIGATALHHRMSLVTRDVDDFIRFDGLTIVDPWGED